MPTLDVMDDAPAPEITPDAAASRPAKRRPGTAVVAVAAVAVIALLVLIRPWASGDDLNGFFDANKPAVAKRAAEIASILTNYDATTLDEQAERVRRISTGGFQGQYEEVIQAGLLKALTEASSSSRGQIQRGPEVSFATPDEAVALVQVRQFTQSSENPQGQGVLYEMKFTFVLTETAGWKVQEVEILSERSS